jgi:hypothetical protein
MHLQPEEKSSASEPSEHSSEPPLPDTPPQKIEAPEEPTITPQIYLPQNPEPLSEPSNKAPSQDKPPTKPPQKPKTIASGLMKNILFKHEVLTDIRDVAHEDISDQYSETNTYYK